MPWGADGEEFAHHLFVAAVPGPLRRREAVREHHVEQRRQWAGGEERCAQAAAALAFEGHVAPVSRVPSSCNSHGRTSSVPAAWRWSGAGPAGIQPWRLPAPACSTPPPTARAERPRLLPPSPEAAPSKASGTTAVRAPPSGVTSAGSGILVHGND